MNMKKQGRFRHALELVVLYLAACLFYAWFVHRFTIPVHLGVDEELYISMARSFHYEGRFAMNGEVLDYSCCLYSMLLSAAYFFYDPSTILFHLRLIGVICMLSSVFPAYLLADRLLDSRKAVLIVVLATVLTPSMTDTAYCMQETLAYPIALWIFYLILREGEQKDQGVRYSVLIGILCVAAYFVKTYLIVLPAAYVLFELMGMPVPGRLDRKVCRRGKVLNCLVSCGIFAVGVLLGREAVLRINGGIPGVNHYATQFSSLFPLNGQTFLSIQSCLLFYGICLLFYWGILPVVAVLRGRRQEEDSIRQFIRFLFVTGILLVLEIVVTIVVTEEGKPYLPHKFLYRYFQILEIPLLCLFMRLLERRTVSLYRRDLWITWGVCGYLALYFYFRGPSMRTAIIDAPLFLLLENASRYGNRFAGSLFCLLAGILVTLVYLRLLRPEGAESVRRRMPVLLVLFLLGFLGLDVFQLPYYCNKVADGSAIEADAVTIARMLNDRGITTVYYLVGDTDRYEQAVYAYQKAQTLVRTRQELAGTDRSGNIVITAAGTTPPSDAADLALPLQTLRVYEMR